MLIFYLDEEHYMYSVAKLANCIRFELLSYMLKRGEEHDADKDLLNMLSYQN
jgi:hypothetical protein